MYVMDFENTVPDTEIDDIGIYGQCEQISETFAWALAVCPVHISLGTSDAKVYMSSDCPENGEGVRCEDTAVDLIESMCNEIVTYDQNYNKLKNAHKSKTEIIARLGHRPDGVVYFHNLKYDAWLLCNALSRKGYKRWISEEELKTIVNYDDYEETTSTKQPPNGCFHTCCTGEGVWYSIIITAPNGGTVTIKDSFKILPFSVEKIAKDFGSRFRKLTGTISYEKHRELGYRCTEKEVQYAKADVLVIADVLAMLQNVELPDGSEFNLTDYLTIGSACMHDFKTVLGDGDFKLGSGKFKELFPELKMPRSYAALAMLNIWPLQCILVAYGIPEDFLSYELDKSIRRGYHGGFCCNFTDGRIKRNPINLYDVNSLYPWAMSVSEFELIKDGYDFAYHKYPIGFPDFLPGCEIENVRNLKNKYYYLDFVCSFKTRPECVPFVQFHDNRWRDNSYVSNSITDDNPSGLIGLTMSETDFEYFIRTHDIENLRINCIYLFDAVTGLFDGYISKWYALKEKNTGKHGNPCLRMLAKLMLNNLYGKLATNPIGKGGHYTYDQESGKGKMVSFRQYKNGGHIACGAAITSYARCRTLEFLNANKDRINYSDTDCGAVDGDEPPIDVIPIDDKRLGAFAHEARFDMARFVRQKTYVARQVDEKGNRVGLIIKACGCPEDCKERLRYRVTIKGAHYPLRRNACGNVIDEPRSDEEIIQRFKVGLEEFGKLSTKQIRGGGILYKTTFRILDK